MLETTCYLDSLVVYVEIMQRCLLIFRFNVDWREYYHVTNHQGTEEAVAAN